MKNDPVLAAINRTGAPSHEQLAYSPSDFAALFGKSPTWGYRLLYAGKVKAISGFGRTLIPQSEVARILQSLTTYEGIGSTKKADELPDSESVEKNPKGDK